MTRRLATPVSASTAARRLSSSRTVSSSRVSSAIWRCSSAFSDILRAVFLFRRRGRHVPLTDVAAQRLAIALLRRPEAAAAARAHDVDVALGELGVDLAVREDGLFAVFPANGDAVAF